MEGQDLTVWLFLKFVLSLNLRIVVLVLYLIFSLAHVTYINMNSSASIVRYQYSCRAVIFLLITRTGLCIFFARS